MDKLICTDTKVISRNENGHIDLHGYTFRASFIKLLNKFTQYWKWNIYNYHTLYNYN